MKLKRTLAIAMFLVLTTFHVDGLVDVQAHGQGLPKVRVTAGGKGGVYYPMMMNLRTYCADVVTVEVLESGGSDVNIERLNQNQADVAVVQHDILVKRLKYDDDAGVKNLLAIRPLHIEAMHPITNVNTGLNNFTELKSVPGVPGGFLGRGAKPAIPGKKIAAWGGSIESAEVLKSMTGVDYQVEPVGSADEAIAALDTKRVDAIIAMGGVQLTWVNEKLKRGVHKFLAFDVPMGAIEKAYKQTSLTYTKLGANAIKTVGTHAVLVAYNNPSMEKMRAVAFFNECIQQRLTQLQGADDTNGQWRNVKADARLEGWAPFVAPPGVVWPANQRRR